MRGPHRALGFTLVEVLLVVAIVGVLVALLLPAVQRARSSARAIRCQSNLRQIVQAIHHYADAYGCFPPGGLPTGDPRYVGKRPPCTSSFAHSALVRLLPYVEGSAIYDGFNEGLGVFAPENTTLSSKAIGLYACPTDPAAGRGVPVGPETSFGFPVYPTTLKTAVRSSYALCYGSLAVFGSVVHYRDCTVPPAKMAQVNGVFNDLSPLRPADVMDGLAQTMFVADRSFGEDTSQTAGLLGHWVLGTTGDTLFYAVLPPNKDQDFTNNRRSYETACSFHPGGVHVAFGDGSVRFVSDSVNSWTLKGATDDPPAPGVWQAMATRNGGDSLGGL